MSDYRPYVLTEQQTQQHIQNMKDGVAVDRAILAFMSLDEPYDFCKKFKVKELLNPLLKDEDFGDVCKCMKHFLRSSKKQKKAAAAKLAENEESTVPETAPNSEPTVVNNRKRKITSPAKVSPKRFASSDIVEQNLAKNGSNNAPSFSGSSLTGKKSDSSSGSCQKARPLGKMNTLQQKGPTTKRPSPSTSTSNAQPSTAQPRKKKQPRRAPMMAQCLRLAKTMRGA